MTDLQKIKISIAILVATDVVNSQQDLALKMGYKNKSSFSQVVNGLVPIPKGFVEKLTSIDENINLFWKYEFNYNKTETNLNADMKNRDLEIMMLKQRIKDLEEKLEMCKELREKDKMLLDKSI